MVYAADYTSSAGLKKLFTTPYEREQLDKRRNSGVLAADSSNIVSKVLNHASSIELKGVVYRKGKRPVVWVNDSNTLKSNSINSNIKVFGIETRKSDSKVRLKVNDKLVKLKPGQVWSDRDNKAIDEFQTKAVE